MSNRALLRKICLLLLVAVLAGPAAGCSLQGFPYATPTATLAPSPAPTASQTPAPQPTATLTSTPAPLPTATLAPSPTPYTPYTLETLVLTSKFLAGTRRTVSVYLPGDYARYPTRQFPVLYSLDGQELLGIAFEQYLNASLMARQVEPVIVVAVHSTDGDLRREELGTGPYLNVFGWGTLSDAFNKFMVSELAPKIKASYRTLPGAQNVGIMGWSLGGLAAFYLAWQYPEQYGVVGAFSPSFWWRTASKPGEEFQARVMHKVVRESAKRPGLRMWFEAGTREDPPTDMDKNGVLDVIQDVQDLVKELQKKGYQLGTDMLFTQLEGGQHNLTTWAKLFPTFLNWAFPPRS